MIIQLFLIRMLKYIILMEPAKNCTNRTTLLDLLYPQKIEKQFFICYQTILRFGISYNASEKGKVFGKCP